MYDLIIIGGGPAGISAGIYGARKQIKTLLLTGNFNNQSIVSPGIENWIGEINISGIELSKKLIQHLENVSGKYVEIKSGEWVSEIKKDNDTFTVKTSNQQYNTKSILIATGSSRKKLTAQNADLFEHKGLTYCASCDGPLFKDKVVAVVGAGNSAFESASQLLAYCKKVILFNRSNNYKADPIVVNSIKDNHKFSVINNADLLEILGDGIVKGLRYLDKEVNEEKEIFLDGIFVEIGSKPSTEMVSALVDLDEYNKIKIDPWTQQTSLPGIWAAGDCTNILYNQNNIASGDAIVAIENLYQWLKQNNLNN